MKNILIKVFMCFFGLIVGFLLCEASLRLLTVLPSLRHIPERQKAILNDPLVYDSEVIYRFKPYTSVDCTILKDGKHSARCIHNKYGIRDKQEQLAKPENTFRIVVLGDSMTYGLGVNDHQSYPEILETIIGRNKDRSNKTQYEVINLGLTFHGPREYINLYQQLGEHYNPDLIIVGFHLMTDPWDAFRATKEKDYQFFKALPDEAIPTIINNYLKNNSYFWRTLLSGYRKLLDNSNLAVNQEKVAFNGDLYRFQYETQLNTNSPIMKEAWQLSDEYLNELAQRAQTSNISTVFVAIPAKTQIVPEEWERIKRKGFVSDQKLYTDNGAPKKFFSLCKNHNWVCIDPQHELRAIEDSDSLFLGEDFHFTEKGNQIIAESIYKKLSEKNYLK